MKHGRHPTSLGVAVLVVLVPLLAIAQVRDRPPVREMPRGTASISGVILSADSDRPVALARVSARADIQGPDLSAGSIEPRVATTDASGRFEIGKLPAGTYYLAASATAYISASYGQRRPGSVGTAIELTEGQRLKIDMRLARGSAITGRILSQEGDPAVRIAVRALRLQSPSIGEGTTTPVANGETDDRGVYRLYGLAPDRYYVSAEPGTRVGDRTVAYALTYYPGAVVQSEAQLVDVPLSQDVGGIDLTMQPAATAKVTGMVPGNDPAGATVPVREMSLGTPSISGVIMSADSGRPVALALVSLTQRSDAGPQRFWTTETTDVSGHFEFGRLPAGTYYLAASAMAYISASYGQRRPGSIGTAIELTEGQRLRIDIGLPHRSAITGRILNQEGEPVVRIMVRALHLPSPFTGGPAVPAANAETDDRGVYRLYDLAPARYYVSAEPGTIVGDRTVTYAPTYYPGAFVQSEAQLVDVPPSQDLVGIDFTVPLLTATTVSGMVIRNDPRNDPTEAAVQLVPIEDAPGRHQSYTGPVRQDGTFVISNVPPGQYLAFAESEDRVAYTPLLVAGRDVTGVTLSLGPLGVLNGQVVFEGSLTPTAADLAELEVSLTPPRGQLALGTETMEDPPKEDGTFVISGIGAGNRKVEVDVRQPRNWTVKSVVVNQQDVTDTYFDARAHSGGWLRITLTDRSTEVSGAVIAAGRQLTPDTRVIAFPVDPRLWWTLDASRRFSRTGVDKNGTYRIAGLPPGDYYLIASDELDLDPRNWDLEQLGRSAARVTLQEGDKKAQDLKVQPLTDR